MVARISWSSRLSRGSRLVPWAESSAACSPSDRPASAGPSPSWRSRRIRWRSVSATRRQLVPRASQLVGEPGRMGRVGQRCGEIGEQSVLVDIELTSRPRSDDHAPDRLLAAAQFENGLGCRRVAVGGGRHRIRGQVGSARYRDPPLRPPVSRCRGASRPRRRHRPGGSRAGSTSRTGCAADRRGTGRRHAARWC